MGLKNGINTILKYDGNNYTILEWIKEGGYLEDQPKWRATNHFLDPTVTGSGRAYPYLPLFTPYAADAWAQSYFGPQESMAGAPLSTGMPMSIWNAVDYFNTALSGYNRTGEHVAPTPEDKKAYLAKAMLALGQVMHLVEDMTVPAHVRMELEAVRR